MWYISFNLHVKHADVCFKVQLNIYYQAAAVDHILIESVYKFKQVRLTVTIEQMFTSSITDVFQLQWALQECSWIRAMHYKAVQVSHIWLDDVCHREAVVCINNVSLVSINMFLQLKSPVMYTVHQPPILQW